MDLNKIKILIDGVLDEKNAVFQNDDGKRHEYTNLLSLAADAFILTDANLDEYLIGAFVSEFLKYVDIDAIANSNILFSEEFIGTITMIAQNVTAIDDIPSAASEIATEVNGYLSEPAPDASIQNNAATQSETPDQGSTAPRTSSASQASLNVLSKEQLRTRIYDQLDDEQKAIVTAALHEPDGATRQAELDKLPKSIALQVIQYINVVLGRITTAQAAKQNDAMQKAETLITKYTMATREGIEQQDEATDIVGDLIYTGKSPKISNPSVADKLRGYLMTNRVNDNDCAVRVILCRYTKLQSYVVADNGKISSSPVSATHMRRVKDSDTIQGGVMDPAAFGVDESKVLWTNSVIREFGRNIPVLNESTPEMQILLGKDSTFTERAIAINRIRHQLNEVGLGQLKILDILSNFAKTKDRKPVLINSLIVKATDEFMETVSGQLTLEAVAMSPYKSSKAMSVQNIDIDFASHFYKSLSCTSGANIYIQKSQELATALDSMGIAPYADMQEYMNDLRENGHPRFFILVPKANKFSAVKEDTLLHSFVSMFGTSYQLVEATIDSHKCILVLTAKQAKALFNI